MTRSPARHTIIPADILLEAYCQGHFPMSEAREDEGIFWLDPVWRGILPLDEFHVQRRLARSMKNSALTVTVDRAFERVIALCAESTRHRKNTWINALIERSFVNLFNLGHAHSVEVWNSEELVGGLYGAAIGSAFFGESMFSRQTDASKIALVHLVARLKAGDFLLLDTQFITNHLEQFGAVEISKDDYKVLLAKAVNKPGDFYELGGTGAVFAAGAVLQLTTQTS